MVRCKAPAVSLAASGAIASAMVFSVNKGRFYARKLTKPNQPQSAAQLAQRAISGWLSKVWADLSPAQSLTWSQLAEEWNLPRYQTYLKFNLERWSTYKTPLLALPELLFLVPASTPSLTPTARLRTILLTPGYGSINANAGFILHHSLTPGFTATKTNAFATVTVNNTKTDTYVHGPLPSGTHYYRATPFAWAGAKGAQTGEQSAVIP